MVSTITHVPTGDGTWTVLKEAVEYFTALAPKDHDVLVLVDDVRVTKARLINHHTFFFEGFDQSGHDTRIVIHFTQLKARIVDLPKVGPERIITGFSTVA